MFLGETFQLTMLDDYLQVGSQGGGSPWAVVWRPCGARNQIQTSYMQNIYSTHSGISEPRILMYPSI